jgi:hypothetical protein
MIDCSNAEMRDRLPDLANESLSPELRAIVLAHIRDCPPCTAEIAIIRTSRMVLLAGTPAVDVSRIVSNLPRAGQARPISSAQRWGGTWRIAAAVTFLVAGAGSYAVLKQDADVVRPDSLLVMQDTVAGLALTGALVDLDEAELLTLADDLGQIEALPSTDVVPLSVGLSGAAGVEIPATIGRDPEGL